MTGLLQDLRLAIRLRPSLTAVAPIILALGLGANATVFGLVNAVLLRPLQVQEPDRVVRLYAIQPDGSRSARLSYPTFVDLRDQVRSLAGVAAVSMTPVALGANDSSEQLLAEAVSGDAFQVLGHRRVGRANLALGGRACGQRAGCAHQ